MQGGVNTVQRRVGGDEPGRGLLTHPGHAGNVVGGISHQGLDVDQLPRLYPVAGKKGVPVVEGRLSIAGQQDADARRDELQQVAVPGQDIGVHVFFCGAQGGKGAQHVIGLVSRQFDPVQSHQFHAFLGIVHLLAQFVRHAFAVGLVRLVHLLAEGGGVQVKGDGGIGGAPFLQGAPYGVDQPVDSVGEMAVLGRERPDAEISAVQDAVSVDQ